MVAKGGSRNSLAFLVVPMIAAGRLTAVNVISPGRIAVVLPSLIAVRLPVGCTALDAQHQHVIGDALDALID